MRGKGEKEEMKKMNNKGFSLVELIIVIAIMAVLIVVLAPQYLKYVEKSRNSTDVTNATEIVSALQIYASDPDATTPIPTSAFNITISASAATVPTGFAADALKNAGLTDASGNLASRCVSKSNWVSYTITATPESGGLTFKYAATAPTGGNDTTATTAFQNAMSGVKSNSGSGGSGSGGNGGN